MVLVGGALPLVYWLRRGMILAVISSELASAQEWAWSAADDSIGATAIVTKMASAIKPTTTAIKPRLCCTALRPILHDRRAPGERSGG